MNKIFLNILKISLSVLMLAGPVFGCGLLNKDSKESVNLSLKPVVLQFYMIGGAPGDIQEVGGRLNSYALRDLNCTVKFEYISWTDYNEKYNMLLSSGQPIDLIYTASWLSYSKLAKNGMFKPLDELLPKYAPKLQKFIPDSYWNQVKVDGKIYTVPCIWREYTSDGFQYRKDLQEQFNLPEPNTLENVEKYFDGIKKNLPEQIITMEYTRPGAEAWSFSAFQILSMKYKWVNFGTPYGLVAEYENPSELKQYWGSSDFIEDMKMFKRWADKGFWPESVLSSKPEANAFNEGKIVALIQGQNSSKYAQTVLHFKTANSDIKVGYVPYPSVNGIPVLAHATQNGFGIPESAKNPERALMFYEKLVLDETYNKLSQYGIEGKHYTVVDGYYSPVGDTSRSGFPREGMYGWAWRNPKYMLYDKSFDTVKDMFENFDKIADRTKFKGVNIYAGFFEDESDYRMERAALGAVMTQYLVPLETGLVNDVESAAEIFMQKAKEAGLEKIQAEYKKQWKAYCDRYNYK